MIIETTDNRFYRVVETSQPGLDHLWFGVQVKRNPKACDHHISEARWIMTKASVKRYASGKPELVRKEASRVVEA